MKFAHMADCHIGSWRDPKLHDLSTRAFSKAVEKCILERVDFVLIAGDLFNTSLPPIDRLKETVAKLKELKDKNIPVYIVPGSHDFSPSGKTMLDVLENAGLLINVVRGEVKDNKLRLKFTVDKKTGVKITGMLGRRGMLEKSYYESLDRKNLENEIGFKIFIFHTALNEFKPRELDAILSSPLSLLPKNFDYYAGGHVHYVFQKKEQDYGLITYPGPLFPNSFKELEDLGRGGFYIYEDGDLRFEPIQILKTFNLRIDCSNKAPEKVKEEILEKTKNKKLNDTIVILRMEGELEIGKPSDINFRDIFTALYDKGAYFVMKNTSKLTGKGFEEIKINSSVADLESDLIREHLGQIKIENIDIKKEEELTKKFMKSLETEKKEGERNIDFEDRLKEELKKILETDKII